MKKDRWDYLNRYDADNQYERSEYIFINADNLTVWSLRSDDDDDTEWQDAVYDEDEDI